MMRAVIYGRAVEMQGSPYTILAYKREFGGDLFADVVAAYEGDTPDMTTMLQVAWAMCKTRDDGTSGFDDWLREFEPKSFALGDARALGVIDSAISAELFRNGKAQRIRRWVADRVVGMAQRAVALANRILA